MAMKLFCKYSEIIHYLIIYSFPGTGLKPWGLNQAQLGPRGKRPELRNQLTSRYASSKRPRFLGFFPQRGLNRPWPEFQVTRVISLGHGSPLAYITQHRTRIQQLRLFGPASFLTSWWYPGVCGCFTLGAVVGLSHLARNIFRARLTFSWMIWRKKRKGIPRGFPETGETVVVNHGWMLKWHFHFWLRILMFGTLYSWFVWFDLIVEMATHRLSVGSTGPNSPMVAKVSTLSTEIRKIYCPSSDHHYCWSYLVWFCISYVCSWLDACSIRGSRWQ